MTRQSRYLAMVVVALLAAPGCSDPAVPPAPTPVPPTVTDMFVGTLLQFGNNSHPFTVQKVGGIQVSVTSIDPAAAIGVGIGTPSTTSGTCLVISNLTAVSSSGAQISGTATIAGNFCINVSDVGNLVEPVNYTITVLHS